ncbi:hypothetical protein ACFP52_01110 [Pseudoalteromonas fenneropenaei]
MKLKFTKKPIKNLSSNTLLVAHQTADVVGGTLPPTRERTEIVFGCATQSDCFTNRQVRCLPE